MIRLSLASIEGLEIRCDDVDAVVELVRKLSGAELAPRVVGSFPARGAPTSALRADASAPKLKASKVPAPTEEPPASTRGARLTLILDILRKAHGPLSTSAIAEKAGKSSANAKNALGMLAKQGLARRDADGWVLA